MPPEKATPSASPTPPSTRQLYRSMASSAMRLYRRAGIVDVKDAWRQFGEAFGEGHQQLRDAFLAAWGAADHREIRRAEEEARRQRLNQEWMDPDEPLSLDDLYLTPIEMEAMAHWKRFQPALCAALEAQGPDALPTAIRKAWWDQEYRTRLTMARNPKLPRDMAEELFRDLLFPPPEE